MSKLHIKRWWSKRVTKSWSDIARENYEFYGTTSNPYHTDNKLIRKRIAKHIFRENKKGNVK